MEFRLTIDADGRTAEDLASILALVADSLRLEGTVMDDNPSAGDNSAIMAGDERIGTWQVIGSPVPDMEGDDLGGLQDAVMDALNGDSNDAEHDALVYAAEMIGLVQVDSDDPDDDGLDGPTWARA